MVEISSVAIGFHIVAVNEAQRGRVDAVTQPAAIRRAIETTPDPRGPIKLDDWGNPTENVYILRVDKAGGIHGLRHAYATHQLDSGVPAHQLQQLLGHTSLKTTEQYVHWIAHYRPGSAANCDLIGALEVDDE